MTDYSPSVYPQSARVGYDEYGYPDSPPPPYSANEDVDSSFAAPLSSDKKKTGRSYSPVSDQKSSVPAGELSTDGWRSLPENPTEAKNSYQRHKRNFTKKFKNFGTCFGESYDCETDSQPFRSLQGVSCSRSSFAHSRRRRTSRSDNHDAGGKRSIWEKVTSRFGRSRKTKPDLLGNPWMPREN